MTSVNVQVKDLKGVAPIETEYVDNNAAVRKMLLERGIAPENLHWIHGRELVQEYAQHTKITSATGIGDDLSEFLEE